MRLQLLLGSVLVIAAAVGISWLLAIRTTDTEFDVLITDTNQQHARLLAPSLLDEYARSGSWAAVQERLTAQIARLDRFVQDSPGWYEKMPQRRGGVVSFNTMEAALAEGEGYLNFDLSAMTLFIEERDAPPAAGYPVPDRFFVVSRDRSDSEPMPAVPIFVEVPGMSWIAGNIIFANQRVIVIDELNDVVVDTQSELLQKRVGENISSKGVPLFTAEGAIGSLIISPRTGIYSGQQNAFLRDVKRGFLYSGLISAGIALVLASGFAYQVTRPVRWLTTAATRIQAGDWGYQVNFHARNEIGQLARAFNDMSRHLAEQRSLRRRLIDDLAHELNTPLSLMRLELQGMVDGIQTPSEAADHLNQELTEVAELISDLIFLANRDTAPAPEIEPVDINTLVSSTVKRFEGSASANHNLKLEPQPDLPPVSGDPDLIQRAVTNLISNAIRHTPSGGSILVKTQYADNQVKVSVQDSGEGIPAEHLPHVFERFYRVDTSRARQSGGRGLGLAIVQQIMEQHDGDVRVESSPEHGSTFTLIWKAAHA